MALIDLLQHKQDFIFLSALTLVPLARAYLRPSEQAPAIRAGYSGRTDDQDIPSDASGRRVLLVEDNMLSAKLVATQLKRLGYECDTAADGRQAIEMAAARPYHAILMDLTMPEVDGIEATRAIRSMDAAPRTPVIALTSSATTENRRKCLEVGMSGFLTKPLDIRQLRQALSSRSIPTATLPGFA